jgi:hypothetical protein
MNKLTLTIEASYNGVAKQIVQVLTPNSNNLVRFDLNKLLEPCFKDWMNLDHSDGSYADENLINLSSFQFSFVDEDEDGGTSGSIFIINARNNISYKHGASGNALSTAWQSKEDLPVITTDQYYIDTYSSVVGFSSYTFSENNVELLVPDTTECTALSNTIELPAGNYRFRINITTSDLIVGTASFVLKDSSDNIISTISETSIGEYSEDVVLTQDLYKIYFDIYEAFAGAGDVSFEFDWDVSLLEQLPDSGIDGNASYILKFKNDYDFEFAGTIQLYYEIPTGDGAYITFEELQPDGTITRTTKTHGVDFSDRTGTIEFTKTQSRWCRAYVVYNKEVYAWAFITGNPILTMFDKIKYYNGYPSDVSVNVLVNQFISGEINDIGYGLQELDFTQISSSTIKRILLNDIITENKSFRITSKYQGDGYNEHRISPILPIEYISCAPANPIYLSWLNSKGGYDYYLFQKSQAIEYSQEDKKEIYFSDRWGANETMIELISSDISKRITCGAESVPLSDMNALNDLILSPFVLWLSNPTTWKWEGEQWVNVAIEKKAFVYNTEKAAGNIELDIVIKRYFK